MAVESLYFVGGVILAFLIGKFYPLSYKKIILIVSPILTLIVILATEYTKKSDASILNLLLFILIPLYLLIGFVGGVFALIPAFIGAKFSKSDFEHDPQFQVNS
jgi:hypothetical protein